MDIFKKIEDQQKAQKIFMLSASIGTNAIQLIETATSEYANDYNDYADIVSLKSVGLPLKPPGAIRAIQATPGIIAAVGNHLSDDDLVAMIVLNMGLDVLNMYGANEVQNVCAILFKEQYINFSQGREHTIEIIPLRDLSGSGADAQTIRTITAVPKGGPDSASEGVFLPFLFSQDLLAQTSFTDGPVTTPAYQTARQSKYPFLTPYPLYLSQDAQPNIGGAFMAIAVVFKGMASYGAGKLTVDVTPVFAGYQTPGIIDAILETTNGYVEE